jgi:hypothetical protein
MNNIINQFNVIAYQLLEELAEIIDTPKAKLSKSVFKTIVEKDSKKPIEQFIIHFLPHKEHIVSKNEKFWINHEIEGDEEVMKLISLKPIILSLSTENKNIVFNYLLQLCKASEYYFKCVIAN